MRKRDLGFVLTIMAHVIFFFLFTKRRCVEINVGNFLLRVDTPSLAKKEREERQEVL